MAEEVIDIVVLMMEKVPVSLRGELSRWMIEPKTGVFVGKVSAMVRDKLWHHTCSKVKSGGALMIYRSQTEQGFSVRTHGSTSRQIVDMEGLMLVRIPNSTRKKGESGQTPSKSTTGALD